MAQAGGNNVVQGSGQAITLPSGQFSSLDFLATSVNGEQSAKFIVTYTDSTTAQLTPALDDWTNDHGQTGEAVAVAMPYRNPHQGIEVYLYSYSIPLNPAKTVASITIPGGGNVEVIAIDLVSANPPDVLRSPVAPKRVPVRDGTSALGNGPAMSRATGAGVGPAFARAGIHRPLIPVVSVLLLPSHFPDFVLAPHRRPDPSLVFPRPVPFQGQSTRPARTTSRFERGRYGGIIPGEVDLSELGSGKGNTGKEGRSRFGPWFGDASGGQEAESSSRSLRKQRRGGFLRQGAPPRSRKPWARKLAASARWPKTAAQFSNQLRRVTFLPEIRILSGGKA